MEGIDMKIIKFILLLFMVTLFFSCAIPPSRMYLVKPITPLETRWFQGLEFVEESADDIRIALAFEKHEGRYFLFQVEIENTSEKSVLFNPADVFYRPIIQDQEEETIELPKIYAVDPEPMILKAEELRRKEESIYQTYLLRGNFADLLHTVADIGETLTEDKTEEELEKEKKEEKEKEEEEKKELEKIEEEHGERMAKVTELKKYWESSLRKSSIEPGQSIRGRLHFPVNKDTKLLEIHFDINEVKFTFNFEQKIYVSD